MANNIRRISFSGQRGGVTNTMQLRVRKSPWHLWQNRALIVLVVLVVALAAADWACPPDLTRYRMVSSEIVDRHSALLRPFLTKDGSWRLATHVPDVSPRYLALPDFPARVRELAPSAGEAVVPVPLVFPVPFVELLLLFEQPNHEHSV